MDRPPPPHPAPGGWLVTRERGAAADFHGRSLPDVPVRAVEVLEVDRPALVLGSTQPDRDADAHALQAAGVALVRRRSGGGAVLLEPHGSLWVDIVVPRADPLWSDDVGVAFHWVGHAWAAALRSLGVATGVHEGALVTTRWSRLVCFAGLGPGEVTADGAKVVGIAQRRTRGGARFQCALLHRWDPAATLDLLALDPVERLVGSGELVDVAAGIDLPPDDVVEALVATLPT
jgi:lipoate-protein ligase A